MFAAGPGDPAVGLTPSRRPSTPRPLSRLAVLSAVGHVPTTFLLFAAGHSTWRSRGGVIMRKLAFLLTIILTSLSCAGDNNTGPSRAVSALRLQVSTGEAETGRSLMGVGQQARLVLPPILTRPPGGAV